MVRFTSDLTWRHQFQLVNIDLVTTACQDCQQLLFYKFHKELELLCKPYVPCTKVFSVSMKMMATDKTSVSKHSVGGVVIGLKSIKNDIGQRYFYNCCPKLKKLDWWPPKPLNIDIGQSLFSNKTIESPKKIMPQQHYFCKI